MRSSWKHMFTGFCVSISAPIQITSISWIFSMSVLTRLSLASFSTSPHSPQAITSISLCSLWTRTKLAPGGPLRVHFPHSRDDTAGISRSSATRLHSTRSIFLLPSGCIFRAMRLRNSWHKPSPSLFPWASSSKSRYSTMLFSPGSIRGGKPL